MSGKVIVRKDLVRETSVELQGHVISLNFRKQLAVSRKRYTQDKDIYVKQRSNNNKKNVLKTLKR